MSADGAWYQNVVTLKIYSTPSTFMTRSFRGKKMLSFRGWDLKIPPKYFLSSTGNLKCRKIKVSRPKDKIKMPREKSLKIHLWNNDKKKLEKSIFLSVFLKLCKLEMIFQKQDFYVLDERNKQTWQPQITEIGTPMKKMF